MNPENRKAVWGPQSGQIARRTVLTRLLSLSIGLPLAAKAWSDPGKIPVMRLGGGSNGLDIVDAQIHIGPDQVGPDLKAMDALGISAALLYEFWGRVAPGDIGNTLPGYSLPNGAWRTENPTAEIAAILHPDRFAYVINVDRRDPELESILKFAKSTPHIKAIRILPVRTNAEADAFVKGEYDRLFDLVQSLDIPVFAWIPGNVALLAPYLKRFPRARIAVDHCGMPFANLEGPKPRNGGAEYFNEVLRISEFPNAYLKWSHAQNLFGITDYPYKQLTPFLRAAVSAFGAERIMWASDNTVIPEHTWGGLLDSILYNEDFDQTTKSWILGGALRSFVKWPRVPVSASAATLTRPDLALV